MALTCVFACLGVGLFVASNKAINASAATEEELLADITNNGQLAFSTAPQQKKEFKIVDRTTAAATLPDGYSGALIEFNRTATLASGATAADRTDYINVDFSGMHILAEDVVRIVVRIWVENFDASADEFRTIVDNDNAKQVQYGVGKYDLSTWCDITLTAKTIDNMTDADGYLANTNLGLRDKGSNVSYVYIDSISVITEYTTYELGPTCLHTNSINGPATNRLYLTLPLYKSGENQLDEAGNEKEFTWVDGTGVLVNGEQISPCIFKQGNSTSFFRFYTDQSNKCPIQSLLADDTTPDEVTVGGTFINKETGIAYIFEDSTYIWDGTTWAPKYTVDELGSLTFTHTSSGNTAQLYFKGENAVKLALGGRNNVHWEAKYSLKAGSGVGVVLNGEALDVSTISLKFPGSVFIDLKSTPAVNSTLTIGGTFYSVTTAQEYVIEESDFVWNGSAWVDAASAAPVEYTIHNLGKLAVHNHSNGQTTNVPKANQLYMKIASGASIPYPDANWDTEFTLESGAGWKLNGEAAAITKDLESTNAGLFINLEEINVQVGDVLSVEGTFVSDDVFAKYVIAESKFQWNGTIWEDYVDYRTFTVTKVGANNDSSSTVAYLYSAEGDLLPKSEGDWSAEYTLVAGSGTGVTLNGTALSHGRIKLPGDLYLPLNTEAKEGDILVIDGTYVNAAKAHKFVFVNCQLQFNGSKWVEYVAPTVYATYTVTKVGATGSSDASTLYLYALGGDELPKASGEWTSLYTLLAGSGVGFSLNGTAFTPAEIKMPGDLFVGLGKTAVAGDVITIDGTFYNEAKAIKLVFVDCKLQYNGEAWVEYVAPTVYETYTVTKVGATGSSDASTLYLYALGGDELPKASGEWTSLYTLLAGSGVGFSLNGTAFTPAEIKMPGDLFVGLGKTAVAGDVITIDGTFYNEAKAIKLVFVDCKLQYNGSAWVEYVPYTVHEIGELTLHGNSQPWGGAGSQHNAIYLQRADGKALPFENWDIGFVAASTENFKINGVNASFVDFKSTNAGLYIGFTRELEVGEYITISGTFVCDANLTKYVVEESTFTWTADGWIVGMPVVIDWATYTVTEIAAAANSSVSIIEIYAAQGDALPKDKANWNDLYTLVDGVGFSLNGTPFTPSEIKFPNDLRIVLGVTVNTGDVLTINGTFANENTAVKMVFVNCQLKWNGEAWVENVVTPEPPVVEYTVYEIGALDFHGNVNAGGNGIIYLKRADGGALPVLDWHAPFVAENAENFKINGVAANCLEIKSTSDGFYWKFNKLNAGDYITISGTFVCESKLVKYVIEESKFVWNGSAWDKYVDYAVYNVGSVYSPSGSATALDIAKSSGSFEVTEGTWTEKLTFLAGSGVGVTLNGKQIAMNDIKIPNNLYVGLGTTAKVGDVLAISGTFYNANLAVKYIIEYHEFTWTGVSWALTFNDELLEEYDLVTPIDFGLGSTINISGTFDGAGLSYVTSPANTTGSLKFRFGYRTSGVENDAIWFRLRGGNWEGETFRIYQGKVGPLSKESFVLANNTDYIIEIAAIDLKDGSGTWIYVSVDGVIVYSAKQALSSFHTSHLSIYATAANATISTVGIVEISYETENGIVTEYVENNAYYTLPEGKSSKAFVGWIVGGEFYFAGEEILVSTGMVLEAVELDFTMDEGAAIRITDSADESGIRFTSRINTEIIDLLTGYGATITYGTLIMPYDYLEGTNEPNLDDYVAGTDVLKIVSTKFENEGEYIVFRGAMTKINEGNYDRLFAGRAYIVITIGEDEIICYTPFNVEDNVRSIRYVAQQFKKDTTADFKYSDLSAEKKAIVDAYAAEGTIKLLNYEAYAMDNLNVTAWYHPALDESNGYFNVTNDEIAQEMIDAGIKTVILDGAHHINLDVPENVVKTRQMIRFFWSHGIKTVVFGSNSGTNPNLDWATMGYPDFSDCEGFEGFLVWDEPQSMNNAQLAEFAKAFEKTYAGTDVTFMVNLLPSYASIFNTGSSGWFDATIDKLKKSDYQAYLKNYCDTVLTQVSGEKWLSLDTYPINADYTLSSYFLFDLAMLKYYAEYAGATSHAVLQSSGWVEGEHDDKNRMPTAAEMEMQAYTAMALGIDSISWWSYSDKRGDNQSNPTDSDEYMARFAAVNSELNAISAVYSAFDWKGVILGAGKDNGFLTSKDDDYEAFKAVKGQIGSYELTAGNTKHLASVATNKANWNYIMGVMEDMSGNEGYVLCNYNNHDGDRAQTITITFDSNITEVVIYRDGVAQTISVTNKTLAVSLATGEGVIIIPSKLG